MASPPPAVASGIVAVRTLAGPLTCRAITGHQTYAGDLVRAHRWWGEDGKEKRTECGERVSGWWVSGVVCSVVGVREG